MKNKRALLLSTLAMFAVGGPALAQDPMSKPSGAISASVKLTATVTKIDAKDRWVTLKLADGTTFDVQAGPAVKNFAQIRVGDKVVADQEETVAVAVLPPGAPPPVVAGGSSMTGAPAGSKPMGVEVDLLTIAGNVTAIDYAKRRVTLQGPDGNSHTFQVGPLVQRLNDVKTGDTVQVNVKRVTTIEVMPRGK